MKKDGTGVRHHPKGMMMGRKKTKANFINECTQGKKL